MATGAPQTGDRELIAAVLKGDQESFSELVDRYQGRVVNYLFRLLRDVDEAHDLAQEVFLKIYQALDRYDPQYKFSTWLFRVARNAAIDRIRKRRIHFVSMDTRRDDHGPEGTWEPKSTAAGPYSDLRNVERGAAIQQAIDALPWEYRQLIVLRHYGELTYDEIATSQKMPLGTVKNKLFRARQMLKGHLRDFLTD
jgi:RNA polymerase sigma-70 factor (ECF subfamily)